MASQYQTAAKARIARGGGRRDVGLCAGYIPFAVSHLLLPKCHKVYLIGYYTSRRSIRKGNGGINRPPKNIADSPTWDINTFGGVLHTVRPFSDGGSPSSGVKAQKKKIGVWPAVACVLWSLRPWVRNPPLRPKKTYLPQGKIVFFYAEKHGIMDLNSIVHRKTDKNSRRY